MALTRKFLAALGIEADKVDEIIEAHSETVNALKKQRDEYKEDADKLPGVQKELNDYKKKVDEDGDNDWESKYNTLKTEYDDYKEEVKNKETMAAKRKAVEEIAKDFLSENGVAKAIKYADWSAYELDDKGALKDSKKHIDDLKEEWADYVLEDETHGANTKTPPKKNGGNKLTREEIMKIQDTQERQNAWAEYIAQGDD